MHHRWVIWAGVVVCLGVIDTEAESPSRRALLLATHGEPRLAWDALRSGGSAVTDADAALAVRLLTELGRFAQAESLLARESAPRNDRAASWYYLRRARLNLDAGRPDRALELLAATESSPSDPLSAYLELVRAQALGKKGDAAGAFEALDRARGASMSEALAGPIDEERVKVLRALGRPQEALAILDLAIHRPIDAAERRRLLALRYDVARETGDDALAFGAAFTLLEQQR